MKINHAVMYRNEHAGSRQETVKREGREGSNVFAGDLGEQFDPISQKKQAAKEQAMKIVGDAFSGDKKIDAGIEQRREHIRKLKSEIGKAQKEVNDMEGRRKALMESYGIAPDSKEQKELELLEKEQDAKMPWKKVQLTEEERKQLAQIKEDGLTEYQSRSLEMKEYCTYYEKQIFEMNREIVAEAAINRSVMLERLKNNPMEKAKDQASAIMDAASREAVGMLMEEAKTHMDEELEEKKEAAEKKAQEEKELEEKLENAKERKREQEELTEDLLEAGSMLIEQEAAVHEVQDEVQKMLDKMKLLEEDIKGAAVDEIL